MKNDAVDVLGKATIGYLASVCSDGSPWSTPVQIKYQDGLISWMSGVDAVHSKNIEHDSRVSLSVVDYSDESSRAVYISSTVTISEEKHFSSEYQVMMAQYSLPLGDLDVAKSEPNRYYFKASRGTSS